MYYHINGELCLTEPHTAVIDCGGVGYKLTVSNTTLAAISPKLSRVCKFTCLTPLPSTKRGTYSLVWSVVAV